MKNVKIKFTIAVIAVFSFLVNSCTNNSNVGSSISGNKGYDPDEQQILIGDDIAIANTQYGKVKGYISRGIYTFMGIPYGASTEGKNRFMPPQPPEPWDGVKPTVYFSNCAPQHEIIQSPESYDTFRDHDNYTTKSEDCLRLNVWSPALDNFKRPVIVWIHGGGYSFGNAIEQDGYYGENFARAQDAVYCSINHRLNSFGFSDFASVGGEKYKHSGNVGMLDIIASLQWIHDNIENFGGDPGNVTIIGQSGGGSKVCVIATMPAAKGLIHKAVALSGNSIKLGSAENSEKLGEYILKEANLKPSEIDKLQQMPWKEYLALANRALANFNKENNATGVFGMRLGFNPVGDDVDIPSGTFFSGDRNDLPDVPMIICSTFHEFQDGMTKPEESSWTKEDVIEQLAEECGANSDAIYNGFEEILPESSSPADVLATIKTNGVRESVINTANAKRQQKSPVYTAWFGWSPDMFNGRMRAFHCIDICFWFNNTDLYLSQTGGGKVPRMLSEKMSDALGAFMRTGNPNSGKENGLPEWPEYTEEEGAVMILDSECKVMNDPDRKLRELMPAKYKRFI